METNEKIEIFRNEIERIDQEVRSLNLLKFHLEGNIKVEEIKGMKKC